MEIEILRLSHRLPRDERISTHVALVARAFGASSITYTGQHDSGLEDSVKRICDRWGGKAPAGHFSITYEKSAIPFIKRKKKEGFAIIHTTMYGLPVQEKLSELKQKKLLIVVGSEHVPGQVYQLADLNIAVTSQPHSEVAGLALFLHEFFQGRELARKFPKAKLKVIPQERGKKVLEK